MKASHDPEANSIYVQFSDEDVDHTDEVRPGIIVDYDARGHVIGIEMLDAKTLLSEAALKSLAAA